MKEKYESPKLEIILFDKKDTVTTMSGDGGDIDAGLLDEEE